MSFTVRFWSFSKRYNSTKHPSTADATNFDCIIKDGSAIINPKIVLDLGRTTDPSQYNYCRIPAFNRYYWVREWSFDRGLWTATLEVDVLATYKTEIGASSLYILRAAGAYNGNIVDNLYPTKVGASFSSDTQNSPYSDPSSGGAYIIGVVSQSGDFGSMRYYALTRASMAAVMQFLIQDVVDPSNGFSVSDATMALQNSIVDPIQYIKSAVWVPVDYGLLGGTPTTNITIYDWTVPGANAAKIITDPRYTISVNFTIPKHPDTAARGNYVNISPYTVATLAFPPFGLMELDTSVICNESTLSCRIDLDLITGSAVLMTRANNITMNRISAQLGVPIQLSQVQRDYMGALQGALGAVGNTAGAIGSFLTGNVAGGVQAIAGAASGIGSSISALAPRANTIGSGGNYSVLQRSPSLHMQFNRPVNDDLTQNGRPLCEKRVINTLSGYMLIQDGDVSIAGTRTEAEQIRAYLEGGFYYE